MAQGSWLMAKNKLALELGPGGDPAPSFSWPWALSHEPLISDYMWSTTYSIRYYKYTVLNIIQEYRFPSLHRPTPWGGCTKHLLASQEKIGSGLGERVCKSIFNDNLKTGKSQALWHPESTSKLKLHCPQNRHVFNIMIWIVIDMFKLNFNLFQSCISEANSATGFEKWFFDIVKSSMLKVTSGKHPNMYWYWFWWRMRWYWFWSWCRYCNWRWQWYWHLCWWAGSIW